MATAEQRIAALSRIAEAAVAAERETGCPAELSAAQCILESGWLEHAPGNNPFGIKQAKRHTDSQACETTECVNGETVKCVQKFAVFPSLTAAFADHGNLIRCGAPYREQWERYIRNPNIERLALEIAPVYATDPAYGPKLLIIIRSLRVRAAIAAARAANG